MINVDYLVFTQPVQIDRNHFSTSLFLKEKPEIMYGIIILEHDLQLNAKFTYLRNAEYIENDTETIMKIKSYLLQVISVNGKKLQQPNEIKSELKLTLNMGIDIVKNGEDGQPLKDENGNVIVKHIEVKEQIA